MILYLGYLLLHYVMLSYLNDNMNPYHALGQNVPVIQGKQPVQYGFSQGRYGFKVA